ncbi:MAG TPA: nucleotide pyrophosphohydrolase [Mycobacteriales bacterium]|nr:nucleotide pyrophosphohydrolase [Mycobacteriales bacterium]
MSELQALAREFAYEREWQQYHSPRSLALALVGEVGELSAEFQWLKDEEILGGFACTDNGTRVRHELGDVLYCMLRLADVLQVDLEDVFREKLRIIGTQYPVELARGSREKWSRRQPQGASHPEGMCEA